MCHFDVKLPFPDCLTKTHLVALIIDTDKENDDKDNSDEEGNDIVIRRKEENRHSEESLSLSSSPLLSHNIANNNTSSLITPTTSTATQQQQPPQPPINKPKIWSLASLAGTSSPPGSPEIPRRSPLLCHQISSSASLHQPHLNTEPNVTSLQHWVDGVFHHRHHPATPMTYSTTSRTSAATSVLSYTPQSTGVLGNEHSAIRSPPGSSSSEQLPLSGPCRDLAMIARNSAEAAKYSVSALHTNRDGKSRL